MDFFKKDELDFFSSLISTNQKYRKGDATSKQNGAIIKETIFAKTNHWAKLVAAQLPEFTYEEDNVWNQSGNFKKYSWARLYLKQNKARRLYVTVGVNAIDKALIYKFDCQREGSQKLDQASVNKLDEFVKSNGIKRNKVGADQLTNYDWYSLVGETVNFINKHLSGFKALHNVSQQLSDSDEDLQQTTSPPPAGTPLNRILYGPPGTGKTFSTTQFAMSILEGGEPKEYAKEDPKELQKRFNNYIKEGRAEFITFHQNYGYEDFVVGIKPKLEGETMAFKKHEGVFYKICQRARDNYLKASKQAQRIQISFEEVFEEVLKPLEDNNPVVVSNIRDGYSFKITKRNDSNLDFEKHSGGTGHKLPISTIKDVYEGTRSYPTNGLGTYIHPFVAHLKQKAEAISKTIKDEPLQTYVLVIDEINRANISRVLGELITLLEPDKRLGAIQELEIKLSNGETFSVPPNLYIIGTMNTADKSIALLDIALRRRFVFKELLPDESKVADLGHRSFLVSLNKIVFKKKGKDFLVGHSYFMGNNGTPVDLEDTMNHKVLPLLAEYFYNKELEMASVVKEAISNSDLKQKYVATADPDGFNKVIFKQATEDTTDAQSN